MAITYVLWHYDPSVPAAVAFAAVFAILTTCHLLGIAARRALFCIPFLIGGGFEAAGYVFRAIAHYNTDAKLPYALQSVLILLGPIFFAASVYMTLGRIITTMGGEHYSIIPPRWLTKVFVAGDITCFLIQGAGGGILSQAKTQSKVNLGEHIILGGLILQIVIFGVFIVVAGVYHARVWIDRLGRARNTNIPWERYLLVLYLLSVIISGRNIFRVAEYAMGSDGYLLTHEWTLYVFDAAQMAIVMVISLVWYKARLVGTNNVQGRRDIELLSGDSQK